jgi:hypothetical protein
MEPAFINLIPLMVLSMLLTLPYVVPLWRIMGRTGQSSWLSLLTLLPVIGLIVSLVLMWVVAFRRWPSDNLAERFE